MCRTAFGSVEHEMKRLRCPNKPSSLHFVSKERFESTPFFQVLLWNTARLSRPLSSQWTTQSQDCVATDQGGEMPLTKYFFLLTLFNLIILLLRNRVPTPTSQPISHCQTTAAWALVLTSSLVARTTMTVEVLPTPREVPWTVKTTIRVLLDQR